MQLHVRFNNLVNRLNRIDTRITLVAPYMAAKKETGEYVIVNTNTDEEIPLTPDNIYSVIKGTLFGLHRLPVNRVEIDLGDEEIFGGNHKGTTLPERYQNLKTVRLGEQSYDCYGEPLDPNQYRPFIYNISEEKAVDDITMAWKQKELDKI